MKAHKLPPPLVYMMAYPSRTTGLELMKYSLLDLCYHGVLSVFQEWRLPYHRSEDDQLYTLVTRGSQFQTYRPNPFQDAFVQPFRETEVEIQLPLLNRMVLDESKSYSRFKRKHVYEPLLRHGLMHKTYLEKANVYSLTGQGKALSNQFREWIKKADEILQQVVEKAPHKAGGLLEQLGAQILLLPSLHAPEVQQLVDTLKARPDTVPEPILHFLETSLAVGFFTPSFEEYFKLKPRGTYVEVTNEYFRGQFSTAPRMLFGAKDKSAG